MSHPAGLEDACPACARPAGDHTLREWWTCMGSLTTNLPYEEIPTDARAIANQLGLPAGTILADNVVVKATVLDGNSGPVKLKLPAVLHEFSCSPRTADVVARVIYVGDPTTIRAYGRLVRDSANGAANAAERAAL